MQKSYKTLGFSTIRGLVASQGGTKQQDQQEEQQEGPKGSITISDPPSLGLGASLGSSLMLYDTRTKIALLLYSSIAPGCLVQGLGSNTPMGLKARRVFHLVL